MANKRIPKELQKRQWGGRIRPHYLRFAQKKGINLSAEFERLFALEYRKELLDNTPVEVYILADKYGIELLELSEP